MRQAPPRLCRNGLHPMPEPGRCKACRLISTRRCALQSYYKRNPDAITRASLHTAGEAGLPMRFWSKVQKTDTCWLWLGNKGAEGHGQMNVGNGKKKAAYRLAYEAFIGPIPPGMHLDHLCRNPPCVNPAHLEPVTPGENVRRGHSITNTHARKTHCKWGHPFDEQNTRLHRNVRHCRTCSRIRGSRYYHAKKSSEPPRPDEG